MKSKLAKNTVSSLFFQITTVVSGFIIPRLLMRYYGSEVNGLINSIDQFLHVITFLELGIGAVVQSSLYKPLLDRDYVTISSVISSASNFFKKIGEALLIYVLILIIIYPYISNQNFDRHYTGILILAMSISSFAQYLFGAVDRLLLSADQRGYILYRVQTITLIANTLISVLLTINGFSIQFVKLTSSLVYLLRPILIRRYVNNRYRIDRKIQYDTEPIKQKWNGIAQHISAVIIDSTDNIVLTIFSTLTNVSIYSVYNMVVYGVRNLFTITMNGVQALLGSIVAKGDEDEIRVTFSYVEWCIHTVVVVIFGCTAVLIRSFVTVYTKGITDAVYDQAWFAYIIVAAHGIYCLRLPYHMMIKAEGTYRETQNSYIIAAAINLTVSIIVVRWMGLVGVAIGTLMCMLYQTGWMVIYNSKHFIQGALHTSIKQLLCDFCILLFSCLISSHFSLSALDYFSWILMAGKVFLLWVAVSIVINIIFYKGRLWKRNL